MRPLTAYDLKERHRLVVYVYKVINDEEPHESIDESSDGVYREKNTLIIEEDRNSRGGGETILISMKFPLANLSTHRDICVYIVHSYHIIY